jgi:hypothetical protein
MSLFTPYPLFEWDPQSKEVLLDLLMKWAETQHLMHKVALCLSLTRFYG